MVATSSVTASRLRAWKPTRPVKTMAVFSNVGELATAPPPTRREPTAVVFGAGHRSRTWRALTAGAATAGAALRAGGVTEIVDVGPELDAVPDRLDGLPVRVAGPLPAAEVSARLARARVGIADYPLHVMTKSGIVAAYLAHGLLCLNTSEVGKLPDDLAEGREFVSLARLARGDVDIDAVAAAGHAWYGRHDVAATAELVLFLDDDVRLPDPGFLAAHLRNFDDPAVPGVYGQVLKRGQAPTDRPEPALIEAPGGWRFLPANDARRCLTRRRRRAALGPGRPS